MRQVIDLEDRFNVFVGDAGDLVGSSADLLQLLTKRLEFFGLANKVPA